MMAGDKQYLTKEDIKNGWKEQFNVNMSDKEVDDMFRKVDFDGSGQIEYDEFIVASMAHQKLLSKKKL